MAELKNGIEQHPLTEEEARKGGQKSGETRRKKRDLKMCLNILMEQELSDEENGKTMSGAEALALKAFREALDGNPKFWEIVRDTAGQKPVEKVMVAEVEQSTLDDIEALVAESKKIDEVFIVYLLRYVFQAPYHVSLYG